MEAVRIAELCWGPAGWPDAGSGLPAFRLVHPAGGLPPVRTCFMAEGGRGFRVLERGGAPRATAWEDDEAEYVFMAGVTPADLKAPRGEQAASVFLEMEAVLAMAGMSFADVVRTWLYIDRVCEWYAEFNAARTAFFEDRGVFEHFLPASTGIGSANAEGAAITAGAFAMRPKAGSAARAELVESPLQRPAMSYRSSFSRAAEIVRASGRQLFVSGTASIRPDSSEVAYPGDAVRQVDCTMSAVEAILASRGYGFGDATRAVVYLKSPEHLGAWRDWLRARGLPASFAAETVCDVCRDEWLFEIEVDAAKGPRAI